MNSEHKKDDWPPDEEKKYDVNDWTPPPSSKRFPGETRYQVLFGDDAFRNEETKTTCPACAGSGKEQLAPVGPVDSKGYASMYRYVVCRFCNGERLVTASKARKIKSGIYRKEGT